jgi:hypothetical protein
MVLPILDDFKPELIINSAGQDNHYSDPITNMNFTAQGYALLTDLLKADIAVLEGGYSIEGALPYINSGIILAMAGLDYSNLVEPDYLPEHYRQTPSTTRYIEQTGVKILKIWQERDALTRAMRAEPRCGQRSRRIFYDTDNIYETQAEEIRVCDDCAGALKIESTSDKQGAILAVHIPRKACSKCKEQAYQWYESADEKKYRCIFLQDRPEDTYLERKKKRS